MDTGREKPQRRKKNVYLRYLVSYALVLLIPISLAFAGLRWVTGTFLRREAQQQAQLMAVGAQRLQSSMDEMIERSQTMAQSIWRSDDVLFLLRNQAETAHSTAASYRVLGQLNTLALVNSRLVEDIGMLFTDMPWALTAGGRTTPEMLYEASLDGARDMLPEAWQIQSRGFTGGSLVCHPDGRLVFLQTYPVTPRGKQNRGILLISLRADDRLQAAGGDAEDAYAILDDKTGRVLYAPENMTAQAFAEAMEPEGSVEGYAYAALPSTRLPVTYLYLRHAATGISPGTLLYQSGWALLALCLMLGGLLAVWLAKRQSDPLRRLAAYAKGEPTGLLRPLDPYTEIQEALLEAAEQRLFLEDIARRQRDAGQAEYLVQLLWDDKATQEHTRIAADRAGVRCEGAAVCVLGLICADVQSYVSRTDLAQTPLVLSGSILTQLASEKGHVTAVRYAERHYCFLVPEARNLPTLGATLQSLSFQAQRLLRETYEIDCVIVCSGLHTGTAGLRAAFAEVQRKLEDVPQDTPSETPKQTDSRLVRDAKAVIRAHYADPSLNVGMVAQQLGYSMAHVSRVFKQHTGMGLLQYIYSVQIEEAIKLMHTAQRLTVRQVAAMLGFSSYESFQRVFKRVTGKTPGQYMAEADHALARYENKP